MLLPMAGPPRAANNKSPRTVTNLFQRQPKPGPARQPRGGVWQDNTTPHNARAASPQAAPHQNPARPQVAQTKNTQTQNRTSTSRKTVHLTLWVNPRVKAELERLAELEGLSTSATGAGLLESALQQSISSQHGALLDPIINKAIGRHMRAYSSRLAVLLVRVAFASEQTRSLVTNILGRQPGINPDMLNHILDGSSKAARHKITVKTPQLTALLAEVETWFTDQAQEEGE
jgi:hypothetical protein